MEKALVTGGTGLLGGHLVEQMVKRGYKVRVLARRTSDIKHLETTGAEIVYGDIEDYDSLSAAARGMDFVFHAAARVSPGWGSWTDFENNIVKGTVNMLNASVECGVKRFIYISSATVVGKAATRDKAADENAPCEVELHRDSYYDYAKSLAEQQVLEYYKQGKIWVTVARLAPLYGPRCRLLTDRIYRYVKLFPVLPGKGDSKLSLIYITDVVDCVLLAANNEKAGGQIYNIAPIEAVTFRCLINSMACAMGKSEVRLRVPLSVVYVSAAVIEGWGRLIRSEKAPFLTRSDIKFIRGGVHIDGSKARKELGWQPKISIEEGCRQYVEWRRTHEEKYHC
jgi:nucleoside-diphosphate-sugar epimerase